jgi:hypothetical protein
VCSVIPTHEAVEDALRPRSVPVRRQLKDRTLVGCAADRRGSVKVSGLVENQATKRLVAVIAKREGVQRFAGCPGIGREKQNNQADCKQRFAHSQVLIAFHELLLVAESPGKGIGGLRKCLVTLANSISIA